MRIRGPDLGSINEKMIAIVDGASLYRGKIRTVVRLRKPLAPNLLCRGNLRDITGLLLGRTPLHEGGTDSRDTLEIDYRGRLRAVEFLMIDELLHQGGAATAELLRPMDTHP